MSDQLNYVIYINLSKLFIDICYYDVFIESYCRISYKNLWIKSE